MGTFQQNLTSIVLEISLRDVASGKEVFHTQYQEQATDRFEALFPAALDTTGTIFLFAGLDGISRPICGTCMHPAPVPGKAQAAAANQLLSAVYTAEGKLDQARVVRSADPTLDQAALEATQNWKAEPAKDASGTPVPVRQAIEMSAIPNDPPGVLRAGVNGVTSPQCIYCPEPEYSEEARKARLDGTVVLDITVLPDGSVNDIVVLKTTGHGLEEKAIETVKKWKLKPASDKQGNLVACRVNIEVTFRTYKK
jgi:TonB family protein